MKNITTQQEVLIMTGTDFASRQYADRDNTDDNGKSISPNEKLEEACWNGALQQAIPEVFHPYNQPIKLYIWQLREGSQFLSLEMGEYPKAIDPHFSIDPYLFMINYLEN